MSSRYPTYDRALLLAAKRDAVLELWEVRRYGSDSYGDPDYVSIYGMRPADWHAKGVRVLGRTAVECTRDALGDAIGRDVAGIATARMPSSEVVIVDPFAGSGNTLHWLLRHLPGARGVAFESDAGVFRVTSENIAALGLPIDIRHTDYRSGLAGMSVVPDHLLIAFIAPPWGDALDRSSGLDLRRTTPPVAKIVDFVLEKFSANRVLCAIQIHEAVLPVSMTDVRDRFDWSAPRLYDLNLPGHNHGVLLGTRGWVPRGLATGTREPSPVR